MTADTAGRHEQAGAVNRKKLIDLAFERHAQQLARAPQIAEPFLADVSDKCNRSAKRRPIAPECTNDTEEDGKAAAVVADARALQPTAASCHADVGAFRKHRIEVRCNHDVWLARNTGTVAKDISHAIDANVRQARLLECRSHRERSCLFMKRGRRNLAEPDLIQHNLGLASLDCLDREFLRGFRGCPKEGRTENSEPYGRNRARDHSTDGTAIQTTEELSNGTKKFFHRLAEGDNSKSDKR